MFVAYIQNHGSWMKQFDGVIEFNGMLGQHGKLWLHGRLELLGKLELHGRQWLPGKLELHGRQGLLGRLELHGRLVQLGKRGLHDALHSRMRLTSRPGCRVRHSRGMLARHEHSRLAVRGRLNARWPVDWTSKSMTSN